MKFNVDGSRRKASPIDLVDGSKSSMASKGIIEKNKGDRELWRNRIHWIQEKPVYCRAIL